MSEERALKNIKSAARRSSSPRRKLGEVLIETGLINVEHLTEALKIQQDTGKRLGDILVEKKFITEEEMALALALQLKIEISGPLCLYNRAKNLELFQERQHSDSTALDKYQQ
jgi:hypothetical protein